MTKIMVVDDEPDNVETVRMLIEREGYEIVEARNGDECLEKVKKMDVKPDLILMDVMMPETPVKKVVDQLKGLKVAYLTVVRTSEAEKEDLLGSKNVVDFIQKPFDIDDLVKKVKKIVG